MIYFSTYLRRKLSCLHNEFRRVRFSNIEFCKESELLLRLLNINDKYVGYLTGSEQFGMLIEIKNINVPIELKIIIVEQRNKSINILAGHLPWAINIYKYMK